MTDHDDLRKCCYKARSNRSSPIIQHEEITGEIIQSNSNPGTTTKEIMGRARLELGTDQLGVGLGAERLGALDGGTQSAVDDQLGQDTQSTRHTEQDGVVVGLG